MDRTEAGLRLAPEEESDSVVLTREERRKLRQRYQELEAETERLRKVKAERKRKVTEYAGAVSECLDCRGTVRARLPSGLAPSGYGPELQAEIVLGKIAERLPYRKLVARLERDGVPGPYPIRFGPVGKGDLTSRNLPSSGNGGCGGNWLSVRSTSPGRGGKVALGSWDGAASHRRGRARMNGMDSTGNDQPTSEGAAPNLHSEEGRASGISRRPAGES